MQTCRWGISTKAPVTKGQREPSMAKSMASTLSTGIGALSLPTPQRSLANAQAVLPPPAGEPILQSSLQAGCMVLCSLSGRSNT